MIRICQVAWVVLVGTALPCLSGAYADAPRAEVAVAVADLLFPEGTIFVGSDLYFVDYVQSSVLRLRGPTLVGAKTDVVWHQDGCGANGLLAVPDGLWVACFDGGRVVKISLDGATLATIAQDALGHPFGAPNDFASDAKGGIYISDSGSAGRLGKVFYLDRNGVVREVASGIRFANGIGVSPDGATLYVAESPTGRVLAFSVAADGSLGPARDLIRLRDVLPVGQGKAVTPDSLRVDGNGQVFVALYNGGGVAIVSPAGRLLTLLDVPHEHHTNLAISPDGESLYITAIDDDAKSTYRGQIVRMANPLAPRQSMVSRSLTPSK